MKKLAIAFGALIALILIAILVIPMFVNVDKYRPQIVEAVNQKINGEFELGHLQLSLWGHVNVEIAGLTLKDAQGKEVVSVKEASFLVPFTSLLTGSPVVDLQMQSPDVDVTKNRSGKLNLMTLMKSEPSSSSQASKTAPSQPSSQKNKAAAEKPTQVPAIVAMARLGVRLLHANVTYKDETNGTVAVMKDLSFVAKDLSLSHPSEVSIWSDFDTHLDKGLVVEGPARVDLTFSPEISGGKLTQFSLRGKADFDQLQVSMPGSFEKGKNVAANVELELSGNEQDVKIDKADINFFNAQVKSGGTISNLQTEPVVRYTAKSNDIALGPWVELLPMLKEYKLDGKANFSADVGGQVDRISYQAKLAVIGLTANAPGLKAQPRIDGDVVVTTDQVQSLLLTMKAPGNDLKVTGKVLSFKAPQVTLDVTSPGMDLDQLIDFQKAPEPTKSVASALELVRSANAAATEKQQDLDAMLNPLRENKILAVTTANIAFNLKSLKAKEMRMTDVTGKLYLKDLVAGLESFSMKLFDGTVKANASSQLKPRTPTYKFTANVAGLDIAEAARSQAPMFKNTVKTGKAGFEVSGEGASFNTVPAESNLRAKGSMKITGAEFTTLDVGKMVTDGITHAVSGISNRIPGVGNKVNVPNRTSRYELISSDFGIQSGKFSAPNLSAKAVPNQGVDLKGSVVVGLKDQSLDAKFQIIDTYNYTGMKTQLNGMLCEKGKPFVMPVSAGCTTSNPCYSYGDTASYLAKIAMNNLTRNATQGLQDQLKKQVPNLGNALKGLFGH